MRTDELEPELRELLSRPAQRALAGAGIPSLEELSRWTESDVGQLHGMGPKAMGQLREALASRGLSFASGERSGAQNEQR